MISSGDIVNLFERRLFGLADCLVHCCGWESGGLSGGGWRSWSTSMLLSLMLATGRCLTRRAYAERGLSRSAASCAARWISTGSSQNSFLDLLEMALLSSYKSCIWPDWNRWSLRVTSWLMVVFLSHGFGFGPRTRRSKMKGSFQIGVGSKF